MTVVPRGVLARHHFGAGAVGLALHRYGSGLAATGVRDQLGGFGPPEATAWRTLARWIASLSSALFTVARHVAGIVDRRLRAARAAILLASFAPPRSMPVPLDVDAFDGAVVAAAAA